MRHLLLLCLLCSAARADALSDLKTALSRLKGDDAVHASVDYAFQGRSGDEKSPVMEEGRVCATVEEGPPGLRIFWDRKTLDSSAAEVRARLADPEKKTPTRSAMEALNAVTLSGYLNAAPGLLNRLAQGTLVEEKTATWQDRPARLLVFKLVPKLDAQSKKYVKEFEVVAKLWVGADGLPLAAQNRTTLKGRALLMITFEQTEEESYEYARRGDRLVAVRHMKEEHHSGMGEKNDRKTTVNLRLGDS